MKVLAVAFAMVALATAPSSVPAALNAAANAVFDAAGAPNRETSKVVRIVAPGGGNRGFAQISGSAAAVKATTAVVEISTSTAWTITAFIPVARLDSSTETFQREYGVSVDALIDHVAM